MMALSKFKYTIVMAKEEVDMAEYKVLEKEGESIVFVDSTLGEFEYGAPEPISHPNNFRDRLPIATTCCCCCGLAAVKYSTEVNSKLRAGDIEGARKASNQAQCCITTSVWSGLVLIAIIIVLVLSAFVVLVCMGFDALRGGIRF